MAFRLESSAQSHIGRIRRSNQDRFGVDPAWGLYVVCDGMGGAAGGEVASELAVDTFLAIAAQELTGTDCEAQERSCRALRRATAAANRAVYERSRFDTRLRGMGTTLVAARVEAERATVVHVGDSRAYLVRDGVAEALTEDHSYIAEQLRLGRMTKEMAARSPMQSAITRAVGIDADVHPDLRQCVMHAGDTLLLVSDGLTRHVADDELATACVSAGSAQSVAEALIGLALERGGTDNITCIVVAVEPLAPLREELADTNDDALAASRQH